MAEVPAVIVDVGNDELVSVREAMRRLNWLVEQLQCGEREKFVLMRKGQMVAALVPLDFVASAAGEPGS